MHCQHFHVCGGCTLPDVPYPEQLAAKRARLSQLLGREVQPLVPSPKESRFRSKVAFVFAPGPEGKGLVMGHYALGSQRVVPIAECPVHCDRGNRIAFALRDRLVRAGVTPAGPSLRGILRHVIIRATENDRHAVAMLVVTRNDRSLRAPVKGLLASADRPDGFFVNIHDRPGPYMVGTETIRIDGHGHVKEDAIAGLAFLVSPTAFFQTNVGIAREIVRLVMRAIGQEGSDQPKGWSLQVLDLYSGSGLFALPLATAGARVTAVEENRQAVKDAEANIRLNRISPDRVRLINARVEDALDRVSRDRWDGVVLDPPRQGCPVAILDRVFKSMQPRRAALVSCNPKALATELPFITKSGYNVDWVQAVDMFPHTDHIETVVALSRR